MNLKKEIEKLRKTNVKDAVDKRLKEFLSFSHKSSEEWFSELCFCILTANSKARAAISIQKELGASGFCIACAEDIKACIMRNKHRFHNNKTNFIIAAREHLDIRDKISGLSSTDAREWLVQNIKGLGYKEASHFLRNVGRTDLSILDRHILNLFVEAGILEERPKSLSKNKYLEIEQIFNAYAKKQDMSPAKIDLYMWYMKGVDVLK